MDGDWEEILGFSKELCELFPEGVAFIGGVGVFVHTQSHPSLRRFTAFSHDGDLVMARSDFMDLRDLEVVTTNRRSNKHEFRRNGLQFDVYEEGSSGLIVPVAEILASSQAREGLRVACLQHLLALKLEAYKDREATPKGEKDAADAFKIVLLMADADVSRTRLAYLDDEHLAHLNTIRRSPHRPPYDRWQRPRRQHAEQGVRWCDQGRDDHQGRVRDRDDVEPLKTKGGTGYGQ